MQNHEGKLWFRRKTFGWGWTPCSWEGWTSIVIFAMALALPRWGGFYEYMGTEGLICYWASIFCGLVGLCFYKGESPRWQWGKRRSQ